MAFGKDTDPNVGASTQFQQGQSGNPDGKPKGSIHLSTHIQNILNDNKFFENITDEDIKDKFKKSGIPVKAIIQAMLMKAIDGDSKAFDVLARYGYGTKQTIEFADPVDGLLEKYNIQKVKRENTDDGKAIKSVD